MDWRCGFMWMVGCGCVAAEVRERAERPLWGAKQKGLLGAGRPAESPQFEYVADGKLVGSDVDMAEEITRRMGVRVAWEKIDFKGIVAALTAKRVDVLITGLAWSPERADRNAFAVPYLDGGIGAFTRQSSAIQK